MATIINNPPSTAASDTGNGLWSFLGILLFILVLIVLAFYFVPMLLRSVNRSAPTISVPDKVDVNVNTPQQSP